MSIELTAQRAAKVAGASRRQVDYWNRIGLLKASGSAGGRGARRRYTFNDLLVLAVIVRLRKLGCPLQKIRAASAKLRQELREASDADVLANRTLMTNGTDVYLEETDGGVRDVLKNQYVWSVHLGLPIAETKRRVESLPLRWTETVKVRGADYRLRVTHDTDRGEYIVQCVELPGAMEQGATAREAVEAGRQAIESLIEVEERLGLRSRRAMHGRAG